MTQNSEHYLFTDFIEDRRDDLFEDLIYDEIEEFSEDYFNEFQDWVSDLKDSGIFIDTQGRWGFSETISPSARGVSESDDFLKEKDLDLLNLDIELCNEELVSEYEELLKKLQSKNRDLDTYKCAYRLALSSSLSEGVSLFSKARYWIDAAESAVSVIKSGSASDLNEFRYQVVDFYIKSAGLFERNRNHAQAASSYEKAYSMLLDLNEYPDFEGVRGSGVSALDAKKLNVLKAMRIQKQIIGDHDVASSLFVKEMHLERKNASFRRKVGLYLYWITSGYGENPLIVALNVFILVSISVLLTYIFDMAYILPEHHEAMEFIDRVYYVVVTFTTLGYGEIYPKEEGGKLLANFMSLSGLFYSGMFIATIVRRYSRV
jgi:hypothetical protein